MTDSIYQSDNSFLYNITQLPSDKYTQERREYEYNLQSMLSRPLNVDIDAYRKQLATEETDANIETVDALTEKELLSMESLSMIDSAYLAATKEAAVTEDLSLEQAVSGEFIVDTMMNNPAKFVEYLEDGEKLQAADNRMTNYLYFTKRLTDEIKQSSESTPTWVDLAITGLDGFLLGGSVTFTGSSYKDNKFLLNQGEFDKSLESSLNVGNKVYEVQKIVDEKMNELSPKEFREWYNKEFRPVYTEPLFFTNIVFRDASQRLLTGVTPGDYPAFTALNIYDDNFLNSLKSLKYQNIKDKFKNGVSFEWLKWDNIRKLSKKERELNKDKLYKKKIGDKKAAQEKVKEAAESGMTDTVVMETNKSMVQPTEINNPIAIGNIDVLTTEVKNINNGTNLTPYEYKFVEREYLNKFSDTGDDVDIIMDMYPDEQGVWSVDAPDIIYQGQDKFPQLTYADDAVVFTENPAPGYTRVVYGTGSDGKQPYISFEKAERAAYDRMIDIAKDDGNVVVMAAARTNYRKPSFKAMGTGEGTNAYAEGPALYYSVIENGNDWIAARNHYFKKFEREFWLKDSEINRFIKRLEKSYKVDKQTLEEHADFFLERYLYHFVKNDYNHAKAFKKTRNEFYKAKKYFKQNPYDNDTRIEGFYSEHFKTGPVVNKETGEVFDSIMEAYIEMDAENILKRNPAPVLKTFVVPKKIYDKLVNEQGMTPAQAVQKQNLAIINRTYGTDFVPSYDKEMNETLGKFMEKYGFKDYSQLQKRFGGSIEYSDIYDYIQLDVESRLEREAHKLNFDSKFVTGQAEKIIEAKYRKPYDKVVQERTLKELHRLGIYGSRHAHTNIALNTDKVQKTVATMRLTDNLDGTFKNMYTIENSNYFFTPININDEWYIQNVTRWNDKPVKMYKDGIIMEY